jgi:hypothetical protein
MSQSEHEIRPERRPLRLVVACLVGLAGAMLIWIAAPYNNFIIAASYISDSYLPVAAMLLMFALVLLLNPVLRRISRPLALSRGQLAIVFGILLVASVVPSQGLLGSMTYAVVNAPLECSRDQRLAEAYQRAGIRSELFPSQIAYGAKTPECAHFRTELPPGAPVPWRSWIRGPLWTWGLLVLVLALMVMGLSLIVLPQWRRNERLPFPLLTIQESLVEQPEKGKLFPPLFRSRSFWTAVGLVLVLRGLKGLNVYYPESIPAIPLDWNIKGLLSEKPLDKLPWWIWSGRIYFVFIGVAFFMPKRIGFSIWFFVVAYAIYRMIGTSYVPQFSEELSVRDHRVGAMLVLTLVILWLGRAHWKQVMGNMLGGRAGDSPGRDRLAGTMFALGAAGLFVWLVWLANVQWWWALFYTAFVFGTALLIARIVAETGMPFVRLDAGLQVPFVQMIGAHLQRAKALWALSPASMWFGTVIATVTMMCSRVSAGVLGTHALALSEAEGPRRQSVLAPILVGVLVLGFVVAGASLVWLNYHHSGTIDGRIQPVARDSYDPWKIADLNIVQRVEGHVRVDQTNDPSRWDMGIGHVLFGAVLAAVLTCLCLRSPAWPLHPIGLLMVQTIYGNFAWFSVLVGWLLKALILSFGGARLYRSARPFFIGLILGDVLAAAGWGLDAAVRTALAVPYTHVHVLPR